MGMAAELTGEAGVGGQSASPRPSPSPLTAISSHCGTACGSPCEPRAGVLPCPVGGVSWCTMIHVASPSFQSPAIPESCVDKPSGRVAIVGRCDALRQRRQQSKGGAAFVPSPCEACRRSQVHSKQ